MTYKQLISNLQNGKNFTFSRWGDGEINAILGANNNQNCDGHKYFRDMGMRLYKIIDSQPDYIMGLQRLVQRTRKDDERFKNLISGIDWVDSDVIHTASIKRGLYELFNALKERNIIFVAHEGMYEVTMNFTNSVTLLDHISISPVDCWLEYSEILERVSACITKDVVILYCASMAAEVLIDDVYNEFGNTVTQIDIGSAFDPYCGYSTRSYHKKLNLK